MRMDELYQEIILEHSRAPHHAGLREPFNGQSHQVNTTCGDEVTLRVQISRGETSGTGGAGGDVIEDISYEALGCAISQSATSVMTDLLIGLPLEKARGIISAFESMVKSKGSDPGDEEVLADAVAFAGVARYPNRVKCALLGWKAFEDAAIQAVAAA